MSPTTLFSAGSLFIVGMLIGNFALAQDPSASGREPAIGGYSPVSYFTENTAERGSPEFAVEHKDKLYYLTSQDQVEQFKKNPDKFQPRHSFCPYSLAYGKTLPLDPTNFKIVGDSLLLFHLSEDMDGLKLWNASEISQEELLRRADANWFRVRF